MVVRPGQHDPPRASRAHARAMGKRAVESASNARERVGRARPRGSQRRSRARPQKGQHSKASTARPAQGEQSQRGLVAPILSAEEPWQEEFPLVLRRTLDHGPRGTRGGPQAPRHVHRLDRGARPPPFGVRGCGQLGRRGPGGLLRQDRRHPARRRRCQGGRQRPRHPGRHCTRWKSGPRSRSC